MASYDLLRKHARLLHFYKSRLDPAISPNCPDCRLNPQDVSHTVSVAQRILTTLDAWVKRHMTTEGEQQQKIRENVLEPS